MVAIRPSRGTYASWDGISFGQEVVMGEFDRKVVRCEGAVGGCCRGERSGRCGILRGQVDVVSRFQGGDAMRLPVSRHGSWKESTRLSGILLPEFAGRNLTLAGLCQIRFVAPDPTTHTARWFEMGNTAQR